MNSIDPFEERLAQTPFREAPASLRREILRGLDMAAAGPIRPTPRIRARVVDWLWPHPIAWCSLGVAWIAVALLSIAAVDAPDGVSPRRPEPRVSPAWTVLLREQRAFLNSLLQDAPAPTPALPSEPAPGAQLWRDDERTGLV